MCKLMIAFLTLALIIAPGRRVLARDDLQAIVDKAIQAHGGAEKLNNMKAMKAKLRGSVETQFGTLKFTQQSAAMLSGKVKEVTELDVNNMKVSVVTVYDGAKGWINTNGQTMEMDEKILAEMKAAVYRMNLDRMTTLKDPSLKLSALGETQVNDRPAVGIKVSKEGQKDVSFYFDKGTGLLAKTELRTLDVASGQEVPEERIVLEYQDVDGLQSGKKEIVMREGKKYMELEALEVKYVDRIDDSEFQKP
jgi:hypothetical protein